MDTPKRIMAWSMMPPGLAGTWSVTRYHENAEPYILAAEHERVVAELRAQRDRAFELADKAREDGLARAANVREAFCYASPGSYEEFRSFLVGFDSAIRAMKGE